MRGVRAVVAVVLVLALGACGPDDDAGSGAGGAGGGAGGGGGAGSAGGAGGGGGAGGTGGDTGDDTGSDTGGGSVTNPPRATYQVPDEECPVDYPRGLLIGTEVEAEMEFIEKMPACTNESFSATWVSNGSEVVWEFRTAAPGMASRRNNGEVNDLLESAFLEGTNPSHAILVPHASAVVDLPPEQVAWEISLPYTFGWAGQDFALTRLESAAQGAAIASLKRRGSPGRAAALACGLAGYEGAQAVSDQLEDADTDQVIVDALGVGAAGAKCRLESRNVRTVSPSGAPSLLSDDLAQLGRQTEWLDQLHVRLDTAQRGSKLLTLGLRLAHKGG
ncbi:hypothetical protein SAMN04489867_0444 [Pedococcus dokdonensis]|uniref:Uncharacterized protein n=1 Tax=Pedococcus dokdonensis TaxID=443156 RepID=A0A1H0LZK3_9MICO|nr:hypothetical protein [Pedococcus dokdonensis]SDO73386.1 hypothetical protein SAMN04489867_0444 [Pedococcus dokdonensis]